MATKHKKARSRSLQEVIADVGLYPPEAYEFVQHGLSLTVEQIFGESNDKPGRRNDSRHVTGQQLSQGLLNYASARWGLMARTVLRRWNITATIDFGRIVFALIDAGQLHKTDDDSIEDFRNVLDFRHALEASYRMEFGPLQSQTESK